MSTRIHRTALLLSCAVLLPIGASAQIISSVVDTCCPDSWSREFRAPLAPSTSVTALAVRDENIYFLQADQTVVTRIRDADAEELVGIVSGVPSVIATAATGIYVGGQSLKISGDDGEYPIVRWDGSEWHGVGDNLGNEPGGWIKAIGFTDSTVVVGGRYLTVDGHPAGTSVLQWDGATWSSLGRAVIGKATAIAVNPSGIYVGGSLSFGDGSEFAVARSDGHDWEVLGGLPVSHVRDLAFWRGKLFVSIDTVGPYVAEWTGTGWDLILRENSRSAFAPRLAADQSYLYMGGTISEAAGEPVRNLVRWDGAGLTSVGGGTNGSVDGVAINGGKLVVGGTFTEVGNTVAYYLATHDSSGWDPLEYNRGASAEVETVYPDGGDVYIGGYFTDVGGTPAHGVARWNGTGWQGIRFEVSESAVVYAIERFGGEIVVAGFFDGVPDVVKWDGQAWSSLGASPDGSVLALMSHGGRLYVGGGFSRIGNLDANGFAIWDGFGWSTPLQQPNWYRVWALTAVGTNVYIGGDSSSSENEFNHIARWDGTQLHTVGGGIGRITLPGGWDPTFVRALATNGTDLFVAGNFFRAGETPAESVARWDGSNWHPVGDGVRGEVHALLWTHDLLVAGGNFSGSGDELWPVDHRFLAAWDGTRWDQVAGGVNDWVNSLAADERNLYVGGRFTQAGDVSSSHFAGLPLSVLLPRSEAFSGLPSATVLSTPYPNPFSHSTMIPFELERPGDVSVRVFDVLGRQVAVLADGPRAAGRHELEWNAGGVSSGLYVVRMAAARQEISAVRTVVLTR